MGEYRLMSKGSGVGIYYIITFAIRWSVFMSIITGYMTLCSLIKIPGSETGVMAQQLKGLLHKLEDQNLDFHQSSK